MSLAKNILQLLARLKKPSTEWSDFCERRTANLTDDEFYFDFFYGSYTVPSDSERTIATTLVEEAKYVMNFIDEIKAVGPRLETSKKYKNNSHLVIRPKRQAGDPIEEAFTPYVGAIFYTFPILQFSIPFGGPVKLLGISLFED